jgi:hypothetical protein
VGVHLCVDVLGWQVNHSCEQAIESLAHASLVVIFALKSSGTIDRRLELLVGLQQPHRLKLMRDNDRTGDFVTTMMKHGFAPWSGRPEVLQVNFDSFESFSP